MLTHTFDSCIYPPQQPVPPLPSPHHPLLQPLFELTLSKTPKQSCCLAQMLPVSSALPTFIPPDPNHSGYSFQGYASLYHCLQHGHPDILHFPSSEHRDVFSPWAPSPSGASGGSVRRTPRTQAHPGWSDSCPQQHPAGTGRSSECKSPRSP